MIQIKKSDYRLLQTGFYNIYPIFNEISHAGKLQDFKAEFKEIDENLILDDYYGRVLNHAVYDNIVPYGLNDNLQYYPTGINENIVDTLRVPYRKIPIFDVEDINKIPLYIKKIENDNLDYEILLRGQNKTYTVQREDDEQIKLYGDSDIKEPSFLPSHLRHNFNEFFIQNMWYSQASILLNDIGVDYSNDKDKYQKYVEDVYKVKGCNHITGFALGIAQHYGMPSVGLDLTKDLKIAKWFALHKMKIDENGATKTERIDDFASSTIFVFRAPKLSVYSYKNVKPKIFPKGRPDIQDAWFGHTGWG